MCAPMRMYNVLHSKAIKTGTIVKRELVNLTRMCTSSGVKSDEILTVCIEQNRCSGFFRIG